MRRFIRERSESRSQQALKPSVCLSRHVLPARPPRQRSAPSLEGYVLSPPHKSRRPSMTPRESPRAQLQKELPSMYKYK